MKGSCIHIYTNLNTKHKNILLYEWFLQWAKKNEVINITVFKAIAGMYNHKIEEQHFVEMGSCTPILISIILDNEQAFLTVLQEEKMPLFYTKFSVEFEKN